MKANELRIGTLVWNEIQGVPCQVDLKIIRDQIYGPNYWQPIPLTEEWLIKMGFEICNSESTFRLLSYKSTNVLDKEITKDFEVYVNLEDGISISLDSVEVDEIGNLECINIKLNHIKHVHQLQNLIFSLTNEELTITQ